MGNQADEQGDRKGLTIGWTKPIVSRSIGFGASESLVSAGGQQIKYDGEGHLMTIAPTGAGKGVGCVVPAILQHDGPLIVMDLKAENYAMTRRHRANIGSKVVCIDPFGAASRVVARDGVDLSDEIVGFNPFDLLPYLSDDRDAACRALAEMLLKPEPHSREPFWHQASVSLLAALIRCYDEFTGPQRSLAAIINDLSLDVPKHNYIGTIPAEVCAMSVLMADTDLIQELARYDLSPTLAWMAYGDATESNLKWRSDMDDIVQAVTAEVLQRKFSEFDQLGATVEAIAILDEIRSKAGTFERFKKEILNLTDHDDVPSDLLSKLWDTLSGIRLLEGMFAEFGSFAANASMHKQPENYPLAIHRLARSSHQICRTAAAQPMTADRTWGSILCMVRAELAEYSGQSIAKCLGSGKCIDLDAIRRGDDISLYIAFPPDRVRSHSGLFRVMVEGLLSVIVSRSERPEKRTLMLLDEVAQLGRINLLITAKTLLRGYGVQVWSFWQDISQIITHYPNDWQTIVNNCRVIQVFGRGAGVLTSDLARALDVHPGMIGSLAEADMLAWVDGRPPGVLRRPVCYLDADLKDLCDLGPFAPPAVRQLEKAAAAAAASAELEALSAKSTTVVLPRSRGPRTKVSACLAAE